MLLRIFLSDWLSLGAPPVPGDSSSRRADRSLEVSAHTGHDLRLWRSMTARRFSGIDQQVIRGCFTIERSFEPSKRLIHARPDFPLMLDPRTSPAVVPLRDDAGLSPALSAAKEDLPARTRTWPRRPVPLSRHLYGPVSHDVHPPDKNSPARVSIPKHDRHLR